MHLYKCLNGLINHDLALVTERQQHNYNTRNKVVLRLPSAKRNWRKQRTVYHATNDFNSLSSQVIRKSAVQATCFLFPKITFLYILISFLCINLLVII